VGADCPWGSEHDWADMPAGFNAESNQESSLKTSPAHLNLSGSKRSPSVYPCLQAEMMSGMMNAPRGACRSR